ncbi:hypothetical protein IE53DRAFT_384197 [Violaceomyces palustris]|uniref:Uncharacterized protein n=1 Tax=Violaceomyces palustris TaxID=1673888 RepID=A0ACD0P5K4_9BASI|nr:hypothetical protein IE53DRAFT_384197 [Violaceomyces palustris]
MSDWQRMQQQQQHQIQHAGALPKPQPQTPQNFQQQQRLVSQSHPQPQPQPQYNQPGQFTPIPSHLLRQSSSTSPLPSSSVSTPNYQHLNRSLPPQAPFMVVPGSYQQLPPSQLQHFQQGPFTPQGNSMQRPIHSMPQPSRFQQHPVQHPASLPRNASSSSSAANSVPGGASYPAFVNPTAAKGLPPSQMVPVPKRLKKIGDGVEIHYLQPGPSNRLFLSLKSGLPSQIDWALNRLATYSFQYKDQPTLESIPGLADALFSFPRRLVSAVSGQPSHTWEGPNFEHEGFSSFDVGIGAPGEGGNQGAGTWHARVQHVEHQAWVQPRTRRFLVMPPSIDVKVSRLGALGVGRDGAEEERREFSFDPSHNPSHNALMRRALEASLILRNATLHMPNAKHIMGLKYLHSLVRDVLSLPTAVLCREQISPVKGDASEEREEWLELEGISELRLHFLDILEGIAPKLHLSQRADFSIIPGGSTFQQKSAEPSLASSAVEARGDSAKSGPPLRPQDEIFLQLLNFAHHSSDRALLLGSLRCLSAMAASDKNEVAFVEVDHPDGSQSPGLLARCVELLPLTMDQELLEATTDLLYQLVCLGSNGLRLALYKTTTSPSVAKSDVEASKISLSSRAAAQTDAVIKLLVRNLAIGKVVWERDHKIHPNREWSYAVPGKSKEEREAKFKRTHETPAEKARRKRLTVAEKERIAFMPEPHRGLEWMNTVFARNPQKEVTQMEFWSAYKDEFSYLINKGGANLQPAADLIRNVQKVFAGATAMVIPAVGDEVPARFIIRGIEVRERDLREPNKCEWQGCPSPMAKTYDVVKKHVETHTKFSKDGRCCWLNCDYTATVKPGESTSLRNEILKAHVMTHLITPARSEPAEVKAGSKRKKIVVNEDLKIVQGADHTGQPVKLEKETLPNGARLIRGKRGKETGSNSATVLEELARPSKPILKVLEDETPQPGAKDENEKLLRSGPPSLGTVENPGVITFEVVRTPSAGNEEPPAPQGVAFVSLLTLRLLARTAASTLDKAGRRSKEGNSSSKGKGENGALIEAGEERFGLPMPSNHLEMVIQQDSEGVSGGARNLAQKNGGTGLGVGAGIGPSEDWAVECSERIMDSMVGIEDELVDNSIKNDILCRYINDTLIELRPLMKIAGTDSDEKWIKMHNYLVGARAARTGATSREVEDENLDPLLRQGAENMEVDA